MSYILDALRRADAERERGVVPGLHSNTTSADTEPSARDRRPLWWAGIGGGVVVVGLAVLLLGPWRATPTAAGPEGATAHPTSTDGVDGATRRVADAGGLAEPSRSAAPQAQPARGDEAAPTARTGAGVTSPLGRRPLEPPATVARNRAQETPSARMASPAPAPAPAVAPAPAPAPAIAPSPVTAAMQGGDRSGGSTPARTDANVEHYGAPLDAPQSKAQSQSPAPAPAQAATNAPPAASPAIKKFEDLPADVRSSLPKLTVGGAIYSDTPSARMLILNGQVWHEGEHPTPDTVLEKIKLKSAVMNYRGTRYEISF